MLRIGELAHEGTCHGVQGMPPKARIVLLRALCQEWVSPQAVETRYDAECAAVSFTSHANATSVLSTQLALSRTRCERILSGTAGPADEVASVLRSKSRRRGLAAERIVRAEVCALEAHNERLGQEVQQLEATLTSRWGELRDRRADVQRRRLAMQSHQGGQDPEVHLLRSALSTLRQQTAETHAHLVAARRILVQEVVDVFGIIRTSSSRKAALEHPETADRHSIAGLDMPSPRRFGAYSSTHVNGTLQHLVHLLSLLADYLGIVLPFRLHWAREGQVKLGDSPPFIGKVHLDAAEALPFIQVNPSRRRFPRLPTTDSRDSDSSGTSSDIDFLLSKPKMLYVSTGREKWRKAEGDKHKTKVEGAASAVLVSKRSSPDGAVVARGGHVADDQDPKMDRRARKEEELVDAYTMLKVDMLYLAATQGLEIGSGIDHMLALVLNLASADDLGLSVYLGWTKWLN